MNALLKRPIEQCRDIGRETSSSVLAVRQSARWSNAPRALRCYCISRGWRGMAKVRALTTGLRSRDTAPKPPCATTITRTVITLPEELRRSLTWGSSAEPVGNPDRLHGSWYHAAAILESQPGRGH